METAPGVRCLQRAVPIRRVGLYVPGGSAPLFSTVLMLAVPARVAGCEQIVLCTPPQKDGSVAPAVLYAASVAGVRHIFKAGGAQAIGAMAYGTQSIPRVDKIFGPGNQYVTAAKQQVASSSVAIDMPAGPSEVLVMADSTAVPAFVAADLLSQAEHGPDSQTVLLTPSRGLAEQVAREVERQLAALPRRQTAALAIENSRIVVLDSPDEMIEMSNAYAPEHLILSVEDPWAVAERITAAGKRLSGQLHARKRRRLRLGNEPHAADLRLGPLDERSEPRQLPPQDHLSADHARRTARPRPDDRDDGLGRGPRRAPQRRDDPPRIPVRTRYEERYGHTRTLSPEHPLAGPLLDGPR